MVLLAIFSCFFFEHAFSSCMLRVASITVDDCNNVNTPVKYHLNLFVVSVKLGPNF